MPLINPLSLELATAKRRPGAGPKNILVVIRHPVGGIRTYLKYTYGLLDSQDIRLTILAVEGQEAKFVAEDLKQFHPLVKLARGSRLTLQLLKLVWRELRSNSYDLIHSQGLTAGVIASLAGIGRRVPHLITSHDVFIREQFSGSAALIKKKMLSVLLSRADIIQSVSAGAQENLLRYLPSLGTKPEKLRVIQNGIPVEQFLKDFNGTVPLYQSLDLNAGTVIFGFLGRFMPQKGFEYIIDAVQMLKDRGVDPTRFVVLAVNEGAYIREYKARIREKGLESYFIFYGFSDDIPSLLSQLNAVLMPSLWEACGLVAMEALVSGCPLIATDSDGLNDVIAGTPALRIRSRDAGNLADVMLEILSAPALMKERFQRYASTAAKRFDVAETARELEKLINQIVTASEPSSRQFVSRDREMERKRLS